MFSKRSVDKYDIVTRAEVNPFRQFKKVLEMFLLLSGLIVGNAIKLMNHYIFSNDEIKRFFCSLLSEKPCFS